MRSIYISENRRDWWAPYRQCLWASLHFRYWCIAVHQISVGVVLHHKLARIEPIVELVKYVSAAYRIKHTKSSAGGRWRKETIRRHDDLPPDFLEHAMIYS
jgi:hypothetical protein